MKLKYLLGIMAAVLCLCGALTQGLFAGELEIHATAEKMPTTLQGPFVHIKDGILCVEKNHVHRSFDGGKTWKSKQILDPAKYIDRFERTIMRTKEGTIVFVFMNDKELHGGREGWGKGNVEDWVLPVCVTTSTDEGETWSEPLQIQKTWCGAIRCMIQLENGRIVLVGQTVIPWRHATLTYVSDDQGKSWKASELIILDGNHDHDGAMEATIVERKDHSIYMLIRTTKGVFFESTSTDSGLTWTKPVATGIQSSTCCGMMTRLADGRISLLWNRVRCEKTYNYPLGSTVHTSREELSIAFSSDDAKTWSQPLVIAASRPVKGHSWASNQVSYPYMFEISPGKFWVTTMFGDLRMCVNEKPILDDIAALTKKQAEMPPLKNIVLFGDSTTALRSGVVTYGQQLQKRFEKEQLDGNIVNSGVPGSTIVQAMGNFNKLVKEKNPKLVVIQFGLNDSAIDVWKNPPAKNPRVSKEQYEKSLRTAIQKVKGLKVPVIVMTTSQLRWCDKTKKLYGKAPYDGNDPKSMNEVMLRGYNEIIRKVAREEKVPLVDVFAAWDKIAETEGEKEIASLLLDDMMHPGTKGHTLVLDLLYPVIRDSLELKKCPRSFVPPLKKLGSK